jgi:hypothetical protein
MGKHSIVRRPFIQGKNGMFAEPQHDRRRFFGMAALSLGAAWIGTRDSVLHMITVKPFRSSSASDLARSVGRPPSSIHRN